MVVRLRLARHGTRNNPFYHLVAIADHKPRDALPIEKLGEYDPIPRPAAFRPPKLDPNAPVLSSGLPGRTAVATGAAGEGSKAESSQAVKLEKRLELDGNRIKYWLSVGAQPSKPVAKMLDKVSTAQVMKNESPLVTAPSIAVLTDLCASLALLPRRPV